MIVEGLVSTLNEAGALNVAPMGPRVDPEWRTLVLRPFQTSTTFENLAATRAGVFHVTDDALMLARAAIGLDFQAPTTPATSVRGALIASACRCFEFRVVSIDTSGERAAMEAEICAEHRLRDFVGWNRARHAILELAILATRADFWDPRELHAEFRRLEAPIKKTGGADEREAYDLLRAHTERALQARGFNTDARVDGAR